jgi:hypothetical protein
MLRIRTLGSLIATTSVAVGVLLPLASPAHAADQKPAHPVHSMGAKAPREKFVAPPKAGAASVLPSSVDLTPWTVPIANQGQVSSCVAWTIDYAMMGWYSRHDNKPGQPFAPMYTYSQINGGVDKGSYAVDALKVALNQGSDTRADYWQGDYDWQSQPTAAERTNAANYKITGYRGLFSGANQGVATSQLQTALAGGKPAAIGIAVRDGFNTLAGTAVDYDTTSPILGYHEILAVGYDSTGLLIQNSWGTGWGNNGFGKLSWNVVEHDVTDAYTIDGLAGSTTTTTDRTAPAVSAPTQTVSYLRVLGAGTVPVTFNWAASDASGIRAYQVYLAVNGAWQAQTLPSATAKSIAWSLNSGSTYRLAVAAQDNAGNWSGYAYGSTFTPRLTQDTSTAVKYNGSWTRYSSTAYSGGSQATSGSAGAWTSITFTGRSIGWVAARATNRGQARVWVDGTYAGIVDTYASATSYRTTVLTRSWAAAGTHTLTIQVVGTSGRPSVDADAFATLA